MSREPTSEQIWGWSYYNEAVKEKAMKSTQSTPIMAAFFCL
jgi:hypothetical protein